MSADTTAPDQFSSFLRTGPVRSDMERYDAPVLGLSLEAREERGRGSFSQTTSGLTIGSFFAAASPLNRTPWRFSSVWSEDSLSMSLARGPLPVVFLPLDFFPAVLLVLTIVELEVVAIEREALAF